MAVKSEGKIYVKWIRSAIGFPRKQKRVVRSLGLGRLNQIVERPNTPNIRGMVASVPHLVAIVEKPPEGGWRATAGHTIIAKSDLSPVAEEVKAPSEAVATAPAGDTPASS